MPVLGHAFVGAATALSVPPARARSGDGPAEPLRGATLWLPAMVVLAYLPDIAAQLALLLEWPDARMVTHSLLIGIVVTPLVAWGVTILVPVTYRRALGVSAFSIGAHDLLDLAQGTDRQPFWPISVAHTHSYGLIPSEPLAEALLFGLGFVTFLLIRLAIRPRQRPFATGAAAPEFPWTTWLAMGLVMAAAGATHALRGLREHQLAEARLLVESRAYRAALDLTDQADRWPSTARPGRIDHVRGEAFAGLGDRRQAESAFRRSMTADPTYFWALADLADLYASLDVPTEERERLLAEPLAKLRTAFATDPALPKVLARLERKLYSVGPPKPPSAEPR
jgi:membrane-bound metal-dependent hydrolase YbcI (DUF457 family)